MKIGNKDISALNLGTTPIQEVRRGVVKIWPNAEASSAPTNLRVIAVTAYTIELAWDVSPNADSYKLEKDGVITTINGSENNTYTYTNLNADTSYNFIIRSENEIGRSNYSNRVIVSTNNDMPAAPTGIYFTDITSNSVRINWGAAARADYYQILRRNKGDTSWSSLATNVTETYYQNNGVGQGVTYEYLIRSWNEIGSADSAIAEVTISQDMPVALTLSVDSYGENTISLSWTASSNADSYRLEMREPGSASFIRRTNTTNTSYTMNNAIKDSNYDFRVIAINTAGETQSNTISVTTESGIQPVTVPVLSVSSYGEDFISLSWSASENATSYSLEVKEPGASSYINLANVTGTSYTLNNAQSASDYSFRVIAINEISQETSNIVTQTTETGIQPVTAPTLSIGNINGTSIPLSWSSSANAINYDVMVLLPGAGSYTLETNLIGTSYTFEGVENSNYSFKIIAKNSESQATSNVVTAQTEVVIPTQYLVGNYPLNETTGDAIDYASGNDMQVFGSMVRNGNNYEYNGSNTYLERPNINRDFVFYDENGDVPFTFRTSINWKSFYRGFIFSKRVGSPGGEFQLWYNNGTLTFSLIEENDINNIMNVSLDLNSITSVGIWNRLAITYDGSNNRSGMKIFLNGVRADTGSSGLSSYQGMSSLGSSQAVRVGAPEFNNGYRMNVFQKNMKIDKGIALTASHLQKDYQDAVL